MTEIKKGMRKEVPLPLAPPCAATVLEGRAALCAELRVTTEAKALGPWQVW